MATRAAVRPVGTCAFLVETDQHTAAALASAFQRAARRRHMALVDVVTGARSVLVVTPDPAAAAAATDLLTDLEVGDTDDPDGAELEIPVRYDGEDLADVAEHTGLTVPEVVARHAAATYVAAFMGFAPGFAYLTGLPDALVLARREQPRPSVPAGAVAIADRYSAVYPRASPGGWHLLGTTDMVLFDPARRPAATLAAGTRVRFVERRNARRPPDPARTAREVAPVDGPRLEVVEPGPFTTVQDEGRPGHAAEGVSPSGAADRASFALANRLVGNEPGAAVLEVTAGGSVLRLAGPAGTQRTAAVTGADLAVSVDGAGRGANAPFELVAGQALRLGPARSGMRAYVAVAGGLAVDPVLGSRATDSLSGLGPPPLSGGDILALGADTGRRPPVDVAPVPARPDPASLHLGPGPRADRLSVEGRRGLHGATWTVESTSNRVGVRLRGPSLERAGDGELAPEGIVAGAVQLTPSGQLVVFLRDHPVTGGYPVIGVVDPADLDLVAQLRPGDAVHLLR